MSHRVMRFPPALIFVGSIVAGCGSAASSPGPNVPATNVPSPTVQLGLQVDVSPVPVHHRPAPTARPQPTRTAHHSGPYLVLIPAVGNPTSRTITVVGTNLPHSAAVNLAWSTGKHTLPISTTTYTDGKGGFRSLFSVPASPPGTYSITANVYGVPYATGHYLVHSFATLTTTASAAGRGIMLRVRGEKFVPKVRLLLVAYPISRRGKAIVVGFTSVDSRGSCSYDRVLRSLPPGQYVLRAWSASGMTAQMAETFFQVMI